MFQPSATPFLSFSPYGLASPIDDFSAFVPNGVVINDPNAFRAGGPFSSAPSFGNHNQHQHQYNTPLQTQFKMEDNDLDAQEELARSFQPGVQGPLVGEKRSSHVITEEYAKADPVYVAKTIDLPQRFSHYRPILGDGNCGWRAIGFSYFETLIRLRNKAQFDEEIARMISLNNYLETVGGYSTWVFEDMVDETISLMRDLADLVETSPLDAEELLRTRFNDESSNHIIYHLRMLAASWFKGHEDSYSGFTPDSLSVDEYINTWINPSYQWIDNLGMTLLIDVLLKPVGFAVEIVYLDRTVGSQANSHIFQAVDDNGAPTNPGGPMIYLLYRPSHYDILYKDMPVPHSTTLQVNRATNFRENHVIQSTSMGSSQLDLSLLACIPGFQLSQLPPQLSHHTYNPQFQQPLETSYAHSPMSSISSMSPGASSTTTSISTNPASYPAQPPASSLTSPTHTSPHASFPPSATTLTHLPAPHRLRTSFSGHLPITSDLSSPISASTFRPSKYEWEAAAQDGVTFQTSTFRNSHYNQAHYNNANFQPEEWLPDSEQAPGGRKRST